MRPGAEAQEVLDFWFDRPDGPEHGAPRSLWFRKDAAVDAEIARRFGPRVEAALAGGLRDWEATPEGTLARLLLLDQFTRNIYRDTPRAFAGDAQALALARRLVRTGDHLGLPPLQRWFAYMPFEHAEDLEAQDESVRLFSALAETAGLPPDALDYAHRHREVVLRFGRFPHRNEVLGRASSEAELAFLRQPGSRF
ncbi:DUF924 family protein [Caldimonas brevitalea]|uniref:DUF924 family protein n=1 Tax=Caldimonas brevitalea TaxID=413882 RepID=UPI00069A5864|nr:DUF924 family protein [Caldimonas brevitalea]